jgi:hypothetical protein
MRYKISLEVNDYVSRNNMILALVNSGYEVWLETYEDLLKKSYQVCFYAPNEDIEEVLNESYN